MAVVQRGCRGPLYAHHSAKNETHREREIDRLYVRERKIECAIQKGRRVSSFGLDE